MFATLGQLKIEILVILYFVCDSTLNSNGYINIHKDAYLRNRPLIKRAVSRFWWESFFATLGL